MSSFINVSASEGKSVRTILKWGCCTKRYCFHPKFPDVNLKILNSDITVDKIKSVIWNLIHECPQLLALQLPVVPHQQKHQQSLSTVHALCCTTNASGQHKNTLLQIPLRVLNKHNEHTQRRLPAFLTTATKHLFRNCSTDVDEN